jgi:hypothetical protein
MEVSQAAINLTALCIGAALIFYLGIVIALPEKF